MGIAGNYQYSTMESVIYGKPRGRGATRGSREVRREARLSHCQSYAEHLSLSET
jgi:hypothetical protein